MIKRFWNKWFRGNWFIKPDATGKNSGPMLEGDSEGCNDRVPPSQLVFNRGGPTEITSIEGGSVV
jgi:hypothetical protein